MATTVINRLTKQAESNGWVITTSDASGYRKGREVILTPYTRKMEFFKGAQAVRVDLTPAGSVDKISTRTGFSGIVREVTWVPGGARTRAALALDALSPAGIDWAAVEKSQRNFHGIA